MIRIGFIALLVLITTTPVRAQSAGSELEEAIGLYRSDRIMEASRLVNALLSSAEASEWPPDKRARAFTYLAMTEWAMYRRPAAEAALVAAIKSDGRTFIKNAGSWIKTSQALVDSAVYGMFEEGVTLYEDGEYGASVALLGALVSLDEVVDPALAADIHKYLGFNMIAQRKQKLAQEAFRSALRLNPRLQLGDDAVIAPKLRRAFLSVRGNTLQKSQSRIRRQTLLRSLAIPGWGQVYRGSKIRGYGFMAAQAGLAAGIALSVRSFVKSRDDYHRFSVEDALQIYTTSNSVAEVRRELDLRYERYRSSAGRANLMIGLFAGLWVANLFDALVLSRDRETFVRQPVDSQTPLAMRYEAGRRLWQMEYAIRW